MIVVDSNIIVYAINSSSPKHKQAQLFLEKTQDTFVFFHQNILESLRVLTHTKYSSPMNIAEAIRAVSSIISIGKVYSPMSDTQSITFELLKRAKVSGNNIFDVYIVATMLSNNLDTIATDNSKDFRIYNGINVINPFK